MELKVDQETVDKLIGEALLKYFDEDKRQMILTDAIKYLVTKPGGSLSDKSSPLQQALHNAVQTFCQKWVTEYLLENEAFKDNVKSVITEAMEGAFVGERRSKLVSAMSYNLGKAMTEGGKW